MSTQAINGLTVPSFNKGLVNKKFDQVKLGAQKASRYSKLVKTGGKQEYDKKLKDVCIEMESLFVKQMLDAMRKTVPKSGFIQGGRAEEIFEDMLYDKRALSMSKTGSFGLSRILYKELSGGKSWAR